MEFHKISNIFPLMEGKDFDLLVEDIKKNGLIEPIYLYEDKILDGRNRYKACEIAGIKPRFEEYSKDDPLGFVISLNLKRRHLDESQRGLVAERIANMTHGGDRKSNQAANLPLDISQPEAAKMLNVSARTIRNIKAVERDCPELIPDIESGKITAHKATKIISEKKREKIRFDLAEAGEKIKQSEKWNIYHDDIATFLPPKKYDFIITDPPYPKEYLPLWETLAKRTKDFLKEDGLLIAMSGQSYLNQIYNILDRYLTYYWTACYLTPYQPTPLRKRNVNTTWKPILIYSLNDNYKGKIFGDVFTSPNPEKENHDWGQSIEGMYNIIKQICLPGQSVLDPFCGSGSTGIACLMHQCFFDGVDIDIKNVNITKGRLNDYKAI